jgi:hypothetical protein
MCQPNRIEIVGKLIVSTDFKQAWMIREACQDLSTPKTVDVTRIKISAQDKSTFMLDGKVYSSDPFNDGTQKAPIAAIQRPTLFSGYALKPPWKVAGVDYPVGVPSGILLKDPAAISLAGVTVNNVNHIVTVTANDVTLDGYDFARNGGWSVQINGAANTRIVNSQFIETTAQGQAPISTDAAATNLYLGYVTIDGGGATSNPVQGALIGMNGQGLTTEYCWLKNAPSNIFEFGYGGVGGGGAVTIRFNLVEDSGRRAGGGGSYLTISAGGVYTYFQVVFNTSYQTPGGTGAQGWNLDAPGGVQTSEIGNNVMVSTAPNSASYLTSVGTASTGAAVVHDNYFDLSGAFGFAYPGSSGANSTFYDNFDMNNGQALPTNP